MKKSCASAALASVLLLTGGVSDAGAQEFCREFTQRVMVGGRIEEAYGSACMQPDGSWNTQPAVYGTFPDEQPVDVTTVDRYVTPVHDRSQVIFSAPGLAIVTGSGYRHGGRDRHHGWREDRGYEDYWSGYRSSWGSQHHGWRGYPDDHRRHNCRHNHRQGWH